MCLQGSNRAALIKDNRQTYRRVLLVKNPVERLPMLGRYRAARYARYGSPQTLLIPSATVRSLVVRNMEDCQR